MNFKRLWRGNQDIYEVETLDFKSFKVWKAIVSDVFMGGTGFLIFVLLLYKKALPYYAQHIGLMVLSVFCIGAFYIGLPIISLILEKFFIPESKLRKTYALLRKTILNAANFTMMLYLMDRVFGGSEMPLWLTFFAALFGSFIAVSFDKSGRKSGLTLPQTEPSP